MHSPDRMNRYPPARRGGYGRGANNLAGIASVVMFLISSSALCLAQMTDSYYPVSSNEAAKAPGDKVPAAKDGKIRLVIRADDIGFCHGANQALRRLLEARIVTSFSVMVNTPWLDEAAEILREHPEVSVGVHTAVNSEWKEFRWGPVSPIGKVPSLVDSYGKFFPSRRSMMANHPRVEEVAAEVRAQIDLARRKGLKLSYMDHHMSGAVNTLEMQEEFEKIARENGLGISRYFGEREAKSVYSEPPEKKLEAALRNLDGLTTPGLYLLVVHPGTDGPEMAAMTDLNSGGLREMSRHRQAEADVYSSPEYLAALEKKGIELVGYKELLAEVGAANMKRSYTAEPYDKVLQMALQPTPAPPRDIYVFIRVDDLFMRESPIKPQELDAFLAVLEKHGGRAVLSTIPARLVQKTNKGGQMAAKIREFARRGHQIAQHGFNHQCPFSGRTDHEFYVPGVQGYTREQRFAKIREGRQMLEAVLGQKVVTYVAPGGDGKYMGDDEKELLRLGYIEIPRAISPSPSQGGNPLEFDQTASHGLCMDAPEFTWGLTGENYKEMMEAAQKNFRKAAESGQMEWSAKFHDHFTRSGYNNGIVIRWLDEFLTWLDAQKDVQIRYTTFEEYYKMKHPGFSTEIK